MVQLGGTRLRHEIDKIPLWRGNHVAIKQLVEDFFRQVPRKKPRDRRAAESRVPRGVDGTADPLEAGITGLAVEVGQTVAADTVICEIKD